VIAHHPQAAMAATAQLSKKRGAEKVISEAIAVNQQSRGPAAGP
jgi:hypothetical protein